MSEIEYADACTRIAKEAVRIVGRSYASRYSTEQIFRMSGDELVRFVKKELNL